MKILKKISILSLVVFGLMVVIGEYYLPELVSGTPGMIFRTLFWVFAVTYAAIRAFELSRRKKQKSE